MTDIERITTRKDWEARLARQTPHAVYQPVEIDWKQPWDEAGCVMRMRERLAIDESFLNELLYHERVQEMRVTWEQVKQWEELRKSWIKRMAKDPFQFGWISEYFRPILVELCRKRLAHPGEVIEMLVTGGNRPGKTKTLLHLADCNFIYAPRPPGFEHDEAWQGQVMVLHESEKMSRLWHHPEIFNHLPADLKAQARKKSTVDTAFNYNAKGFTNDWFQVLVEVTDEEGRAFAGGGKFEMRNYGQEEDTFQGGEYNTILSDELIPPTLVKTLNARLASRVEMTREPWFVARIQKLLKLLESGEPFHLIHRSLLGAVLQGVHVIAFTPIKGYTATVKLFLAGARKYGWADAPVLKTMAGAPRTQVPRFAQPVDPLRLVAYVPTSANIWKPAYHAIMGGAMSGGHRQVRMKLYGDVEQDQRSEFSAAYEPDIHLCDWKQLPRTGTIYEVFDPAGAKPWAMGWYLVDEMERVWMIQEWPCESIEINGCYPGPWAVVSSGDRLNGDEGPAYDLRLGWSLTRWARQIWEGRRRIVEMMERTGAVWAGDTEERKLSENAEPQRYAMPGRSIIDSRFAGSKVDSPGGGEQITVLERLFDDVNGVLCEPAQGVKLDEGNLLIADKLAERLLGEPALRINRECTNTQFMLLNYTLPEFRETTAKKDEACKEWRDLLAYLLLARPEYLDPQWMKHSGGGSY